MLRRLRSGQGTLEYIIVLAIVVGVIILISTRFKKKISNAYNILGDRMESEIQNTDPYN